MAGDFDPPVSAVREAVARALAEDLGVLGDLTSTALVPADAAGTGYFVARRPGVLAGTATALEVFAQLDPAVTVTWVAADGGRLSAGRRIGTVTGPLRSVLTGERSALNFLGHLSGIATVTRTYVDAAGDRCRIRDTRKTTPGLRSLEKAAVRAGGGANHRGNLSDAVLIKDNHLRHLGSSRGAFGSTIADAIDRAQARWPGVVVEVECDTLDQVAEAVGLGVDAILLDNMNLDELREAVSLTAGRARLEVSGGVRLDTVRAIAETGVDEISVGALTHSARSLDVSLELIT
jgi:nicotinate-nucleotide pyrophosphorylase (carboxylating)